MCYVHLKDNCEKCDSFKSQFGHEPNFIESTYGLPKSVIYDSRGETTQQATDYMAKKYGYYKEKKEIRIFGIKVGEIS